MKNQFEIIGYHGTFTENINNIIKEGYTYTKRDNHWLGQGIYFYNDIELAKWFIVRKYGGHSRPISIISSLLSTTIDKVINLDTNEGVDYLFEKIYELWGELSTITFSGENEIKNRCIILDIVKEYYDIDIIIKTFETDYQSYGRANIGWFERSNFPLGINYNETQICSTDDRCIKKTVVVDNSSDYQLPKKIWFKENKKR